MLFNEAIQEHLQNAKADLQEDQFNFYKEKLQILIDYLGYYDISRFHTNSITSFIIRLKQDHPELPYSYINKYIQEIINILRDVCSYNFSYRKLKDPKHINILSDEQVNQLLNYFRSQRSCPEFEMDEIMFRILIETGVSLQELLSLTVDSFNMSSSEINLNSQGSLCDQLSLLSSETLTLLQSYILRTKPIKYLFTDENKNPVKTYSILDMLKYLTEDFNHEVKITPKMIRKTFSANYLKSGGCIKELRKLLGYRSYKKLAEIIPLWNPRMSKHN
jgi:site-specific recombinase XerD